MDTRILPDDYAEQFGEQPNQAYTQTITQGAPHQPAPPAKKAGVWSKLFGGASSSPDRPATLPVPLAAASAPVATDGKIKDTGNTSTMDQEQLRLRRMRMVENAKFGRPMHENFMLFLLKIWMLVGPIAFVALTAGEVAYILTSLVPPGDNVTVVIWGGALFIDIAMMFTTFGVAIKRRDLADKREVNGSVSKREEAETWFGTLMWLIFAGINTASQSAFLLHIIQSGAHPEQNMTILYLFVAARVVGFILGDAVTAFFLAKVDANQLKLIARSEREKGQIYYEIAKAEGERQMVEAKAEADMRLMQIEVAQREQEAHFMANLKRQMFEDILSRRPAAPSAPVPDDGPNRSRLRRSDL